MREKHYDVSFNYSSYIVKDWTEIILLNQNMLDTHMRTQAQPFQQTIRGIAVWDPMIKKGGLGSH